MRVQHLRFLALLARLGSLTACAKALHLSQPAVSNLLKDLESAFGGTLRHYVLGGADLHDDADARQVTVISDDERPFVIYGEKEGK